MKKAKDGRLIFDNVKDLNVEIQRRIMPILEKRVAEVKIEATKDAGTLMLPLIASALYEAYGFGEKRLEKFVEYFNKHLECLNDGIITVDQYEQWCKDQGYKCLIVEAEE